MEGSEAAPPFSECEPPIAAYGGRGHWRLDRENRSLVGPVRVALSRELSREMRDADAG